MLKHYPWHLSVVFLLTLNRYLLFLQGFFVVLFVLVKTWGKMMKIRFINPYRFKHFNYLKTVLKYGRKNITKHKKGAKKIT